MFDCVPASRSRSASLARGTMDSKFPNRQMIRVPRCWAESRAGGRAVGCGDARENWGGLDPATWIGLRSTPSADYRDGPGRNDATRDA